MQADRKMAAVNIPHEGMANDDEFACLSGIAEAVGWAHATEDAQGGLRQTRRIVIYPPNLSEFSRVLTGDKSNLDSGHSIVYREISEAFEKFAVPPIFISADSPNFGPEIDPKFVPVWMHQAAQIAAGSRKSVLEDGADVCNSESDSENEEHGEVLTGGYTKDVPLDSAGHPILSAYHLSDAQAEILRLATRLKSRPPSDYSSSSSESSQAQSEDSVDEFYRCHPEVPRFSEFVRIRKPTGDEKALINQMVKDSRERFNRERRMPQKPEPSKPPMAIRISECEPEISKLPSTPTVKVPRTRRPRLARRRERLPGQVPQRLRKLLRCSL
jgi:hypothetical protein